MKSILRVFSYLRHYPGLASAQLVCAIGMTMAVFVFPKATGHVIDQIIPNPERHGEFAFWIVIALLGFLIKDGLNSLRIFINNTFEQKVIFDIRSELYAKIQRLPLRWLNATRMPGGRGRARGAPPLRAAGAGPQPPSSRATARATRCRWAGRRRQV